MAGLRSFLLEQTAAGGDKAVLQYVTNLLNGIPSLKLSATDVLRVLHDGIYFSNESNINHCNFVR